MASLWWFGGEVTGWCSGSLVLSWSLHPPPGWASWFRQKDSKILLSVHWAGARTLPHGCTVFLSVVSHFPNPHPHSHPNPNPFGTQGKSEKLKNSPRNKKKGDRARLLYPGRRHRIQFQFNWHSLKSVCWHFILITSAYLNSKDPCLSAKVRLFFFFFLKHSLFT